MLSGGVPPNVAATELVRTPVADPGQRRGMARLPTGTFGVLNHEPVGRQILVVGSDSPSTSERSLLEWVRRSVHMVIRAAPQQCMAAEERVPIALETLNDEEEIDLSGRSVGSGQALSSSHSE